MASRQLILAGGGHTHALLLRRWAMVGLPAGLGVTLVSRSSTALYSGMVPGLIGGLYAPRECLIDLRHLAEVAGATFIAAEIVGLDSRRHRLLLRNRPAVRWDLLSLDVGSITAPATSLNGNAMAVSACALPIKPLETFLTWWDQAKDTEQAITVVGSGAAGLEVALAMAGRDRRRGSCRTIELVIRPDRSEPANLKVLERAGLATPHAPSPHGEMVLCTGSRAPAWLAASGLPCDPANGRVLTTATLQVLGFASLFAVGDCAQISDDPRPPSGVWAVRAAAPLARNLERTACGLPPSPWHPPRWALQLLADGGAVSGRPRAMAQWGPLRTPFLPLLWPLKQLIDRRFIRRFAELPGNAMDPTAEPPGDKVKMACHGCAAKLPAAPLAQALASLEESGHPSHPLAPTAEDAHRLLVDADGQTWLQSVDGFPALVSDPWLNGRLSTLHACSDLWASGAAVRSALAVLSLPRLAEALQADLLSQSLAGIRSVLDPLGADLLGGHTLQAVGPDAETARPVVVLTVNGSAPAGRVWSKGGLRAGDALILTRPLGSGVLFAAAMAGAAEPKWIDTALEVMQQSQAQLVDILDRHGCHGCTDITGFGLLGHLGEMVTATQRALTPQQRLEVRLDTEAIPALEGALNCLKRGLASSLAPSNRASLALLAPIGPITILGAPSDEQLELLVDPQTCGPLLAALPEAAAEPVLADLHQAGFPQACRIGSVQAGLKAQPPQT